MQKPTCGNCCAAAEVKVQGQLLTTNLDYQTDVYRVETVVQQQK